MGKSGAEPSLASCRIAHTVLSEVFSEYPHMSPEAQRKARTAVLGDAQASGTWVIEAVYALRDRVRPGWTLDEFLTG